MASLGVKVGDRIIIDATSSKPKVHRDVHVDCINLSTMYNFHVQIVQLVPF